MSADGIPGSQLPDAGPLQGGEVVFGVQAGKTVKFPLPVSGNSSTSGGGFVPTRIKADQSFTIPENTQAVLMKRIRLEAGARLKAYGILVQAR